MQGQKKKKCITKASSTITDQSIEVTETELALPCPSEVVDGVEKTSSKPASY